MIGSSLGPYEIKAKVGQGGMGVVYQAIHVGHRRVVALKVLRGSSDTEARQRFQREMRIALDLEHRNIVPVYDVGYEDDTFYLAMRMIDGPDLESLAESPLSLERALKILSDIGAALSYVHRHGHVHRDVKPSNILVADEGSEDEYALLTDFGIARASDGLTQLTHGPIGTLAYLAPEVVNWQQATPASDQYSLACLVFEIVSGRPPFVRN